MLCVQYFVVCLFLYLLDLRTRGLSLVTFSSYRKQNGIHQKSGVLWWRCNTEVEFTKDDAKEVFPKERYFHNLIKVG